MNVVTIPEVARRLRVNYQTARRLFKRVAGEQAVRLGWMLAMDRDAWERRLSEEDEYFWRRWQEAE